METQQSIASQLMDVLAPPMPVDEQVHTPAVAAPSEMSKWMTQLCSLTGVDHGSIPREVFLACIGSTTKQECNKKFFAWHTAHKQDITSFPPALVEQINLRMDTKVRVQLDEAKRSQASYLGKLRAAHEQVEHMMSAYAKASSQVKAMDRMLAEGKGTGTEQVQKILSDGWYRFDEQATLSTPDFLVFSTPNISLHFFNKAAGISIGVDMGSYSVHYRPRDARTKVYARENNLDYDGYIHPHVSSDHNVCWGNAKNVVDRALRDGDIYPLFEALRVILQNYNDGSPYVDIFDFAVLRDPTLSRDVEVVKVFEGRGWVDDGIVPRGVVVHEGRYNDHNGTEESFVDIYRDSRLGTRTWENDAHYMRDSDGRYHEVDPADIHDFEESE